MKHTKKPFGARLVSLILAAALMAGMAPALASQGDFQKWKADYDEYWYDPYKEYYEAWGIPSVMQVYEERGEKAADNYIGLFRSNLQFDDAKEQMQEFVSHLDQAYPIIVETPDPTAGWTAENDPYKEIYRSLDLPNFGEVEQQMGRKYAVHWRQVSEGAETGVVKVQGYEYPVEKGLPFSYELMKSWYEADQQQQKEEQEKPYIPPVDHESETIDGIDYEDYIKEHPDYEYNYNQGAEDNPGSTTKYFPDVPNDVWYAEAVNAMAESGLIHGYEDGTFRPEQTLTQGEWATIVWNIVGGYTAPDAAEETIYLWNADGKKVPAGHWASIMLYYAGQKYKYLPGVYPTVDGSAEEAPASRLLAVHSIVWMLEAQNCRSESYRNMNAAQNNLADKLLARQKKNGEKVWTLDDIPDHDLIPEQPENFVGLTGQEVAVKAYNYGVIHGMDEVGTFNAEGHLTRAEACQMLYNALITEPRPIRGDTGGAYGS